jgi:urea transport system permease protein
MFLTPDADNIPLLDEAIADERDAGVLLVMQQARAAAMLRTEASADEFAQAVDVIAERGGRQALGILGSVLAGASNEARPAIEDGIDRIERHLAMLDVGQNVWYGLSLGSVLLLAAIGLAITFGVMGIINMAHGEMVMIGAYTTFVVQK